MGKGRDDGRIDRVKASDYIADEMHWYALDVVRQRLREAKIVEV